MSRKKKRCDEVSIIMVVFNAATVHLVASIFVYEKILYHWDVFPIVLPPPLTVVTAENDGNKKSKALIVKDLYVAPTFEELNIVSLDAKGNPQSLTEKQLKSIRKTGEFEVESINIPGQVHKWCLSQLLQKGTDNIYNTLLQARKSKMKDHYHHSYQKNPFQKYGDGYSRYNNIMNTLPDSKSLVSNLQMKDTIISPVIPNQQVPEKESEMSGRKYASKKQKSSKCDGKKKKKVIDHSIIEKNQCIGEREQANGIDSEFPAESKITTSKLKPKKGRKNASHTNFISISIPMQMEDMTQAKESGMSEGNNASEEPPKSSKRGCKKRKVGERENAIDHPILEKIHSINEGEPVTEIDSESPAEIRDTADKPKPEKARKSASVAHFIPVIPREMEDVDLLFLDSSEHSPIKIVGFTLQYAAPKVFKQNSGGTVCS